MDSSFLSSAVTPEWATQTTHLKFLKVGIMEDGKYLDSEQGTLQGNGASPILANIYLHYVLDNWFDVIVKRQCRGDVISFATVMILFVAFKINTRKITLIILSYPWMIYATSTTFLLSEISRRLSA